MDIGRMAICVLLGLGGLNLAGCNSSANSESTPSTSQTNSKQTPAKGIDPAKPAAKDPEPAKTEEPKTAEAPPEEIKPSMPKVELSDTHAATCLVRVGDNMPDFSLANLAGEQQALADLRGEQGTVVLFWTTKNLYGPAAIEELQKIGTEYGNRGIKVLAVCRKGEADAVKVIADEAAAGYPQLLDPDAEVYGKVATKLVPRTYLLDAEGKIVWFALTWEPRTAKTLRAGLDFMLGETE